MKIICVYSNSNLYFEKFNKEFNNKNSSEPILFIKPDTSLVKTKDFYIPEFSNEIHFELGLVIKISKLGKYILPKNAAKHYEKIGLGLDFTAIDLHSYLVKNGLPWEKSKSFDGSTIISEFHLIKNLNSIINFHLQINNKTIQNKNIENIFHIIDELISYMSKYFTLRIGDLVFIKILSNSIRVSENDLIETYFNNEKILSVKVY